jgi:signal transduction histidine kinase/ActR/RegA family two-component response regulator
MASNPTDENQSGADPLQESVQPDQLRHAEKYYRSTLDALPANIAILDKDGQILQVNKAWKMFAAQNGALPEKVSEGTNYLKICDEASGDHAIEAKPFAKGLRLVMAGKKDCFFMEYPCHSPDKKRWFLGNAAPFRDNGNHVLVVHVNITELIQTRHELRKATKTLEQRVIERTQQVETRTKQLQSLSMELIEAEERERRRFADLLHDDLQQVLVSARMQLQSLPALDPTLAYVQQLLEESIGKSRRLAYELSPPVLHRSDLATALQWLARRMNDQFGLEVRLKIDLAQSFDEGPFKVFMFRAVQELLFNIAKHSGVKSARVQLSYNGREAIIAVSDKGRGFDSEAIESSQSGFGLLSLRERASYMGGSLVIESAPGRGCHCRLTIPFGLDASGRAQGSARAQPQNQGAPASPPECIRVMFADDHLVMRQGLIRMITGHPHIQLAGEAANGLEAIEQARELKPDIIVMDINMPEMDGIEATRRIIAEMPRVRVIGLSVHDDQALEIKMRQAGAKTFLSKTTSSALLLKAIYDIYGEENAQ